jgi:hypothetical protein
MCCNIGSRQSRGSRRFRNIVHTHTHTHTGPLYIPLAVNPTSQTSWDFADKPVESDCFRICIRAASVFPLTDATCVDKFFTPFRDGIRGLRILFQFSSKFSPKSHQKFQFGLAASPSDVCALIVARVPITYYKGVGGELPSLSSQ